MKKNLTLVNVAVKNLLIVLVTVLFVFSACKKESVEDKEAKYREIAWNYLSDNAKATVITPWQKCGAYL